MKRWTLAAMANGFPRIGRSSVALTPYRFGYGSTRIIYDLQKAGYLFGIFTRKRPQPT